MKETKHQNGWVVSAILFIFYFPYFLVNHLPLNRGKLMFILGEENMPFLPQTSILYLSLVVQAVIVISLIPTKKLLLNFVIVAGILIHLHLITFVLFPIEYPRGNYKSNDFFLELFRYFDGPGNCFPSLHVSATIFFASCYSFWYKSKLRNCLMWVWAILITVSVLTVKQHYLIDVLASILLTSILVKIFKKKLQLS